MDKNTMSGIGKAMDRLKEAIEAYEVLLAEETDRDRYQRKWATFLWAANSTFLALNNATKQKTKAKGWYDRVKHERKSDPLLKWMQHARNAEEHQPGRSLKYFEVKIHLNGTLNPLPEGRIKAEPIAKQLVGESGQPVIQFDSRLYVLADVTDINGIVYLAPKTHLGSPVISNSPNAVAKLQLDYLKRIVEEAEDLLKGQDSSQ